ncbi:hypothetical protein CEXT_589101, partial [Caerostris extrusa]
HQIAGLPGWSRSWMPQSSFCALRRASAVDILWQMSASVAKTGAEEEDAAYAIPGTGTFEGLEEPFPVEEQSVGTSISIARTGRKSRNVFFQKIFQ